MTVFFKVIRKVPNNLISEDKYLFKNEFERQFPKSKQINLNFFLTDANGTFITNRNLDENIKEKSSVYKINNLKILLLSIKKILTFNFEIILKPTVWFTDNWSNGYFHWLLDALPRLNEFSTNNSHINIILPQQFDNQEYIKQSLGTLGFKNVKFMHSEKIYLFRKLYFQTHVAPTGNYNEQNLLILRKTLIKNINSDILNLNERIYISRSKANRRKIINEQELIPILKKYKFKIVNFEDFSWLQQTSICSNAKIMIGLHGAGLTNMLFMPENSKILELRRKDDAQNNCYFSLASALNINYYYQLCEVDDYSKTTQENDFYINTEKFEGNITEILNNKF